MAENTIDSLDIRVSSTTTKAVSALENLQKRLGGVNTAFRQLNSSGLRNYTRDVNRFTASLNALNKLKINVTKFSELNSQLQQLSNIDLKNLQNKKISLDIEVTGGDAQKKLRASLESALRETKIDTSAIAKNLSESFNVTSKVAVNEMKTILDGMAKDLSKTWDGQNVDFTKDNKFMDGLDELGRVVANNAKVIQSKTGIYDQFFAYFKNKKIYVSDALKDAMGKDLFNEIKNANIGQIVRDATKGIDISGIWDEMADLFPEHISRDVTNQVDQIVHAFSILKKAREDIEHTISFKDLSAENQADLTDEIYGKIVESAGKMPQIIQSNIQKAIETASNMVDLDININKDKIINDIREAIQAASKVTYDAVDIKLDVNTDNIKDEISQKIKSLNKGNLPAVTQALQQFADTMTALNNVDLKDTGITTVTNALKRLFALDTSAFDANGFQVVVNSISSLATLPDVSSSLNRFISSFSRLATSGTKVSTTVLWLPKLGEHLKDITVKMAGLSEINSSVNLFVQSLARLASAGKKTADTASNLENLGDEVLKFFHAMQKAPQISQDTIRMTEALSRLASAGGSVGKSTSSVTNAMNRLSKTTSGASGVIKNSISKIVGAFKSIGNVTPQIAKANSGVMTLLKSVSLMGLFYKAFNTAKESITLGSDLTEVGNVVKVTFGDMRNQVYEFAETAKQQFGLSQIAAQKYAGTMQGMLTAAGLATKTASDMSIELAGLAGDYASFWNVSSEEAFKAIRSGLAGETEPLRRFGKDMTVATLEAYAMSQGITKAYSSMTYSEKVLLRYNYLLSASGNEMGDFARTSMNFANQMRLLTNNIQDLLTYIGQGFIAAVRPALIALNALMTKLIQAAKAFRTFMYTLTGYKGEGSQGGIVDDLAGVGDMYDDISGIGGAGDNAADGLDNASSSANKLKKSLSVLPFDQLNQLSAAAADTAKGLDDATSDIGGLGSVGDLGLGEIETGVMDLDATPLVKEINEWAESIRLAFTHQQWDQLGYVVASGINNGLKYIYDVINWNNAGPKITGFVNAFTSTFNSLVEWLDFNRMGRVLGAGINSITNTVNSLLVNIKWVDLGKQLANGLMGLVSEVDWKNFGELFANGFNSITGTIYGFFAGLDPDELGKSIAGFVKGSINEIDWPLLSSAVQEGFNTVIGALAKFIEEKPFEGLSGKLSGFLNDMIREVDWYTAGEALGNLVKQSIRGISDFIEKTDFDNVGKAIGRFISGLNWKEIIKEVGKLIWEAINAAIDLKQGLFKTAPIESRIISALAILKFTGLGSKLGSTLWTKISDVVLSPALIAIFGDKIKSAVKENVEKSVEGGINTSDLSKSSGLLAKLITSQFGMLASAITIPVIAGGILASWTDALKGGNGVLTEFGGGVQSLIQQLSKSNQALSDNADELFLLSESYETNEASVTEWANGMIEAFAKSNVSFDEANRALNYLYSNGNITEETFRILSEAISVLGDKTVGMAEKANLAGVNAEEAYVKMEDAIKKVAGASENTSGVLTALSTVLYAQQDAGANAQVAYDAIILAMESMGIETSKFIETLKKDYPEAFKVIEESTETSMANAQKSVDTHMKNASSSAGSSSSSIAKNVVKDMEEIEKAADESFGGVATTSDDKWSASDLSVDDALKNMQLATSDKMRTIYKNVKFYTKYIYNIAEKNWSALSSIVLKLMDEMNSGIYTKLNDSIYVFENFSNRIVEEMNLFNAGKMAGISFANGFRSVHIPTPHMRISDWRQHSLPNGGYMQSPVFEVNWYKDGGIFGNASVIGVGEAGREAVLPLENRRSMRMIADSIVSNAGNGFIDEQTMINAVATGVSMAFMNNQQSQQPINVYATLYTEDNEVLARSVNKGNQSLSYRANR